jgi:hypothetical protein
VSDGVLGVAGASVPEHAHAPIDSNVAAANDVIAVDGRMNTPGCEQLLALATS